MALIPFIPYSNIYVAGATNSGKTYWVYNLLKNVNAMFPDDPPVKILYSYSIYQNLFSLMEKELDNIEFMKGIPTNEDIIKFSENRKHGIIIIDDNMTHAGKSQIIEDLFTKGSHHLKITTIFISQNMFNNTPKNRTMSLNSQYMVITKNPRACSQLNVLASQLFGKGKSNVLCEVYSDVMKKQYGYLVIDLHSASNPEYMLRTCIFPNEYPIIYKILS